MLTKKKKRRKYTAPSNWNELTHVCHSERTHSCMSLRTNSLMYVTQVMYIRTCI